MPLFVVVLLKRTIYNKETKRKAENERSQNGHKKALTADFAPNPKFFAVANKNLFICKKKKTNNHSFNRWFA